MSWTVKTDPKNAAFFDTISNAGRATEAWLTEASQGATNVLPYTFEFSPREGYGHYVVKIKDDMGFTVGYLVREDQA